MKVRDKRKDTAELKNTLPCTWSNESPYGGEDIVGSLESLSFALPYKIETFNPWILITGKRRGRLARKDIYTRVVGEVPELKPVIDNAVIAYQNQLDKGLRPNQSVTYTVRSKGNDAGFKIHVQQDWRGYQHSI